MLRRHNVFNWVICFVGIVTACLHNNMLICPYDIIQEHNWAIVLDYCEKQKNQILWAVQVRETFSSFTTL